MRTNIAKVNASRLASRKCIRSYSNKVVLRRAREQVASQRLERSQGQRGSNLIAR